jgi:serine/threonine protein kinase
MGLSAAEMAQMSFLLDEAIPLDAAGRRRWIEQLAPQHRGLAPALRCSLLTQTGCGAVSIRLDTLPKIGTGASGQRPTASRLKPGQRLGPYRLERQLGAGGMAEVWLAQGICRAFRLKVALKVPLASGLRADLAQRFAHECDILGSLEHRNIVRLYDAGVSTDGLPYLAMEYVPGEPLTQWCDARRLGVHERIGLFLQVLDAVEYAHAHRVIHRDLKPSNVLVTQSGRVRLLDFGVAKLLAYDDEPQTQLTRLYGRALTPDYASPESFRGGPVDAGSDVYSLGVMLHELLTGSRPYRIKTGASAKQLKRQIATACVEHPGISRNPGSRPARAIARHRLTRQLGADLGAIVLKALAIAPEQRYRSASELADDLRRFAAGEAVKARSDRPMFRALAFLRRHRAAIVAAVAAALLGLAVGFMLAREPTVPAETELIASSQQPASSTVPSPASEKGLEE